MLRSVKYGESSLVSTIFTAHSGIETYMVQGVRTTSNKNNKAAYFQPSTLLDLVVYEQPLKNMQRIKEFSPAYLYQTIQEDVVKNSIIIFSVEVLLRLLPEHASLPPLFEFAYNYFILVDQSVITKISNFPLFFVIQCGKILGYELKADPGIFIVTDDATNNFSELIAALPLNNADLNILNRFLKADSYLTIQEITMNGNTRMRLIEWYISFLQLHTQHMGSIRSLAVLRTILY